MQQFRHGLWTFFFLLVSFRVFLYTACTFTFYACVTRIGPILRSFGLYNTIIGVYACGKSWESILGVKLSLWSCSRNVRIYPRCEDLPEMWGFTRVVVVELLNSSFAKWKDLSMHIVVFFWKKSLSSTPFWWYGDARMHTHASIEREKRTRKGDSARTILALWRCVDTMGFIGS